MASLTVEEPPAPGGDWDAIEDLLDYYRSLRPRMNALTMARQGLGATSRQHLERWRQTSDRITEHPETYYDSERFAPWNLDPFEKPDVNALTRNTWLRPGMQLRNVAFEFNDGYLGAGTFFPSDFSGRSVPISITALVAATNLAPVTVFREDREIVHLLNHMPWLKHGMEGLRVGHYRTFTHRPQIFLIVDEEGNALIMREIAHEEIRSKDVDVNVVELHRNEKYMVAMAAIGRFAGITIYTDPNIDEVAFAPVVWVHVFEEQQPENRFEDDGSFNPIAYIHYQSTFGNGGRARLPTHIGHPGFFMTLIPRLDAHGDELMDLHSITIVWMTRPIGHWSLIGPQAAIHGKAQHVIYELGVFALLDKEANWWTHTFVDVGWWSADSIRTFGLKLDREYMREHNSDVPFITTGMEVCTIDRDNEYLLTRHEGSSPDMLRSVLQGKIEMTMDTSLVIREYGHANTGTYKMAWIQTFAHALNYGFYPPSVRPTQSETPNAQGPHWDHNYSQQVRMYYTYALLHAAFVSTDASGTLSATDAKEKQTALEEMVPLFNYNREQRQVQREQENRRQRKLKAARCEARVKDALEAFDAGMRAMLTKNRQGYATFVTLIGKEAAAVILDVFRDDPVEREALKAAFSAGEGSQGAPKPRRFREGKAFTLYIHGARAIFGVGCTEQEWMARVDEYVEAERERDRQERRASEQEQKRQAAHEARKSDNMKKSSDAAEARKEAKAAAERAAVDQAAADLRAARAANYDTVEEHKAALAKAAERAAKLAAAQQAGFATIAEHENFESNRRIEEKRQAKEALKAEKEAERQAKRDAEREAQAGQVRARAQQAQTSRRNQRQQAAAQAQAQAPPPPPDQGDRAMNEALQPANRRRGNRG